MRAPEKLLSLIAIPHLALALIICQFVLYFFAQGPGETSVLNTLDLVPERVIHQHEWWRLFSFILLPPVTNPVFLIFGLYIFWLMSKALESQWGVARFNLYYLIGWAALVCLSMGSAELYETGVISEDFAMLARNPVGNGMLNSSVFLAFAWLFPRFTFLIFFIIPVQVRWLGLLTWLGYLYLLCVGNAPIRLTVLAGIANFLVFFGGDLYRRMRSGNREMVQRVIEIAPPAFHRCAVCGATEQSNADRIFRICTECRPARELCGVCLKLPHDHVIAPG